MPQAKQVSIADGEDPDAQTDPLSVEGLHKRLALTNQALRRTDDVRRRFIANASQAIRNPLNAVRSSVEELTRFGALNAAQQEFAACALRHAVRIDELVTDMLNLASMDTDKLRINLTQTALATLLHAAHDEVAPLAHARGVSIGVHIADDLPQLYLDPMRMRDACAKLLSNAVKYSDAGKTVQLRAQRGPHLRPTVEIRIIDHGIGIAPEDLSSIFEPFFRSSCLTHRVPGGGLGLALVKEYVELHNGTLEVVSERGVGSTFCISLPVLSHGDAALMRVLEGLRVVRGYNGCLLVMTIQLRRSDVDVSLPTLCDTLREHVRQTDYLTLRAEPPMVVLVLLDTPLREATRMTEKVLHALNHPSLTRDGAASPQHGVCIGVAAYPEHGAMADWLLQTATDNIIYPNDVPSEDEDA